MPKRQSRLSLRQQSLLDALRLHHFSGRWWGPAGNPACRIYLRRLNNRGLRLVDPVKVYLEFDKPPTLSGARLVVGRASRSKSPTAAEIKQHHELYALYAAALYVAKSHDPDPKVLAAYMTQCDMLNLPSGRPASR